MRTKPKTLGVVATWPQKGNHVNYKTQDEEMFLAFYFIQVGKLHDPSKLLLQPLWVNVSQCQAEEHFITIIGHFNCLNVMLIHTFFYVNLQKKAKNQQKESQHHIWQNMREQEY